MFDNLWEIKCEEKNEDISQSSVLAYVTDYGDEVCNSESHKKEALLYKKSNRFIIKPADNETEIIVNKLIVKENEIFEGEELIRTKEKLMLVMDSSIDFDYVQVKAQRKGDSSCWIPSTCENYDISLVPKEFKMTKLNK